MNVYWLYDLPTWLFGLLTVAVTVAVGLVGFQATRKWVRRVHGAEHSHNEIVGFYLGAVCLFYGITLGLVAVGTWEAYSDEVTVPWASPRSVTDQLQSGLTARRNDS